jgi:hypothetical protein
MTVLGLAFSGYGFAAPTEPDREPFDDKTKSAGPFYNVFRKKLSTKVRITPTTAAAQPFSP